MKTTLFIWVWQLVGSGDQELFVLNFLNQPSQYLQQFLMYEDQPPNSSESSSKTSIHKYKICRSMFPPLLENKPMVLDSLKKNFNLDDHEGYLINACFRCHDIDRSAFYNEFRISKFPERKEPQISTIFLNQCFVCMEEIGKWIQNPQQVEYPSMARKFPQNTKALLDEIFQEFAMIPNLQRFLLFYPSYLERHFAYYKCLFLQSKFTQQIVYFFGFCAAAQTGSVYMMARMVRKFIYVGGQLDWIQENKYPDNLKKIIGVIRAIGRCPWTINSEMINELVDQTWNLQNIVLILQVIIFVQQMSAISLALGLLAEQPYLLEKIQKIKKVKDEYDGIWYESKAKKPKLFDSVDHSQNSQVETVEETEKSQQKQKEESESYMKAINNELTEQEIYQQINAILKPLLPQYEFIEKRNDGVHEKFDCSDYNFQQMSYPILQGLTQEAAAKGYDLIKYSQKMTFNNFGNEKKENTKDFRRACRYYAENLCGFTHLQYNYKKNITSNKKTPLPLKFYIRLILMSPIHIKKQVIEEINHEKEKQSIECFNMGHIAVMIADTKMSYTLMMITRSLQS